MDTLGISCHVSLLHVRRRDWVSGMTRRIHETRYEIDIGGSDRRGGDELDGGGCATDLFWVVVLVGVIWIFLTQIR